MTSAERSINNEAPDGPGAVPERPAVLRIASRFPLVPPLGIDPGMAFVRRFERARNRFEWQTVGHSLHWRRGHRGACSWFVAVFARARDQG